MKASMEGVAPANPFDGGVKERLYDVLVAADRPETAATLADRAECEPAAAREYLESFVSLGLTHKHAGTPPSYERNDAFLEWEHVLALADDHSLAELEAELAELLERIQGYQDRYGVDAPDEVDATTTETASEIADWTGARMELQRYERARQIRLTRSESADDR